MRARLVVGALGVLAGIYGLVSLLGEGFSDLVNAVVFLAGGVIGHDFVLSPLLLVAAVVAIRVLPGAARAPVTAGLVVLGSITLMAVPVLGRFGAKPDNPTLLDRHYVWGWLVFAVLVAVATGLAVVVRLRRSPRAAAPTGPGSPPRTGRT